MADEYLLGLDILFDKLKFTEDNQEFEIIAIERIVKELKTILDLNDENSIEGMQFILELCADANALEGLVPEKHANEKKKFIEKKAFKHFMYCYNVACTTESITLKLDLLVLLFIELFRAIDDDCGGGISVDEATQAYNNVKKSNSELLNQYSSLFEKIARYADNCGSGKEDEAQVEITEFDFLCVTMKPELLLVHYGNKYKTVFDDFRAKTGSKSEEEFNEKEAIEIGNELMKRGCDSVLGSIDNVMKNVYKLYQVSRGKTNKEMDYNDFGFLYESVKDVMRGKTKFTKEMYTDLVFKIADVDKFGYLVEMQMKWLFDAGMALKSSEKSDEKGGPVRFSQFKNKYKLKKDNKQK